MASTSSTPTIKELLEQAYAALRTGNYQTCADTLNAAQRVDNTNADIFFIGGLLAQAVRNPLAGIAAYEQALARNPANPHTMYNMADCLIELGRQEEAENLYRAAISINENFAPAYVNLGNCHFARGEYDAALSLYQGAVQQQPNLPEALDAEAICLQKLGRTDEAIQKNLSAVKIKGKDGPAFERVLRLADLYEQTGQLLQLNGFLEDICQDSPENQVIQFVRAAKGVPGASHPAVAPHEFVQAYSAWSAASYDQLALNENYLLPARIALQLAKLPKFARVLDAGCGTGILSAYPTEQAIVLTGVDISGEMLAYANNRNAYSQLKQQAIEYFNAECAPDSFDAIVAADLLPHLGRPEAILAQFAPMLKEQGLLYLSFEHHSVNKVNEEPMALSADMRYTHATDYMLAVANKAGYQVLANEKQVFRNTPKGPITGSLLCLQKI